MDCDPGWHSDRKGRPSSSMLSFEKTEIIMGLLQIYANENISKIYQGYVNYLWT